MASFVLACRLCRCVGLGLAQVKASCQQLEQPAHVATQSKPPHLNLLSPLPLQRVPLEVLEAVVQGSGQVREV